MKRLIAVMLFLPLLLGVAAVHAAEITSSTVYAQALQVEKEIELLRRHFNVTARNPVATVVADLQPRHVWQKTYGIMIKLNIFRRKHGLNGFAPVAIEPSLKLDPRITWAQTQRILTEIRIAKALLGIPGEVSPTAQVAGKQPIDVFNKLNQISYDLDALNGEAISPSYVYAEALRLDADINTIMRRTATVDAAVPPARNPAVEPKDSLQATFELMDEIQRLQRKLGIDTTDFSVFRKQDKIVPADVFGMVGLCLAELQLVKAKLGMQHSITPAAEFQQGKHPAEVVQLLGYAANKLHRVNPL